MKRALILCLLLMGCAKRPQSTTRYHSVYIPEGCVVADSFGEVCKIDHVRGGLLCDKVHLRVSPEPRCNGVNPGIIQAK